MQGGSVIAVVGDASLGSLRRVDTNEYSDAVSTSYTSGTVRGDSDLVEAGSSYLEGHTHRSAHGSSVDSGSKHVVNSYFYLCELSQGVTVDGLGRIDKVGSTAEGTVGGGHLELCHAVGSSQRQHINADIVEVCIEGIVVQGHIVYTEAVESLLFNLQRGRVSHEVIAFELGALKPGSPYCGIITLTEGSSDGVSIPRGQVVGCVEREGVLISRQELHLRREQPGVVVCAARAIAYAHTT